jgi:hypothetical protein
MVAALWAYAAHLAQGVAYARSLSIAVVIAGSLVLVWVERAGRAVDLRRSAPAHVEVLADVGGAAPSLFMHVPAVASVFQIQPLEGSDWRS